MLRAPGRRQGRHHHLAAAGRLGVSHRGQGHALLVLAPPGRQGIARSLQGVAEAGHVAMSEYGNTGERGTSCPSTSVRWAISQRTMASAVVMRLVPGLSLTGSPSLLRWSSDNGGRGSCPPTRRAPSGARDHRKRPSSGCRRSGEDIEIVKRITRRGNARPVITTGDAENVTVADDDAVVDDPVGV